MWIYHQLSAPNGSTTAPAGATAPLTMSGAHLDRCSISSSLEFYTMGFPFLRNSQVWKILMTSETQKCHQTTPHIQTSLHQSISDSLHWRLRLGVHKTFKRLQWPLVLLRLDRLFFALLPEVCSLEWAPKLVPAFTDLKNAQVCQAKP